MGRRSINTTKSGKYMNPTDQARKEARKKELKKNKRQRQMVRAAVLKNKDPSQILEEMEKIDEMEYNVLQPSPLNEKVLRDKRKKLKETFDRVMRLYHNDEPEHWAELKRKEVEYEKKRLKKQQYFESVKHAQSVQIDEIPLPAPVSASSGNSGSPGAGPSSTLNNANIIFPGGSGGIRVPPPPMTLALPPFAPGAPPGVAKNSESVASGQIDAQSDKLKDNDNDKEWLGVPPGPPPDLFAMSELDSDAEGNSDFEGEEESTDSCPKLKQRMQNIDDFMKEMEHVHKRKHRKLQSEDEERDKDQSGDDKHDSASDSKSPVQRRRVGSQSSASTSSEEDDEEDDDDAEDAEMGSDNDDGKQSKSNSATKEPAKASSAAVPAITSSVPAPPTAPTLPPIPLPPSVPAPPQLPQLPHLRGIAPPPGIMFRPPPMRPPGPGGLPGFGMRMPPGPPPGARPPHALGPMPRMGIRMPPGPPPGLPPRMGGHHVKHGGNPNVMLNKEPAKGVTTITAKPQIRNLSADVTRFVPSTLRVKRETLGRTARSRHGMVGASDVAAERGHHVPPETHNKPPTKDDAYLQFMNEMQGLL